MSLIILLFVSFFGLCLVGVPVAVSLAISSFITALVMGIPPIVIAQQMYAMLDSYTLLAVPLFLLVGAIMDKGAVTDRLVRFSRSIVLALFNRTLTFDSSIPATSAVSRTERSSISRSTNISRYFSGSWPIAFSRTRLSSLQAITFSGVFMLIRFSLSSEITFAALI